MTSTCMNIQSHDIYDFKLINPLGTFLKVKGSYSGYYMPLVLDFCYSASRRNGSAWCRIAQNYAQA